MRCALLLLACVAAACDAPPVQWSDPVAFTAAGLGTHLLLDTAGVVHEDADARLTAVPPQAPGMCASSVRVAAGVHALHAAWWSVRADSSALLDASESPDAGVTWSPAVAVDTQDVSSRGCNRPPPSIAVVGDDLQVAYSMTAPEGTGVFYAHFMGSMLHSPVAVIYGERLVATAIAAEGDRVAVAYDEPNGPRQRVDLAMSSTQGHIFEVHETASRDVDAATTPAIALFDHEIAVAWSTRQQADTVSSRIVRVGRFR